MRPLAQGGILLHTGISHTSTEDAGTPIAPTPQSSTAGTQAVRAAQAQPVSAHGAPGPEKAEPTDDASGCMGLSVSALLELVPIYQRLVLDKLDLTRIDLPECAPAETGAPGRLTRSQMYILLALMNGAPLNMTQLAARIATSKEQTTRAVAPLVDAGYLRREQDAHNRKLVLIRLTASGEQLLRKAKEQMRLQLETRFRALSEADHRELEQSLQTVIRILKKV